jgi:hypothetical protein
MKSDESNYGGTTQIESWDPGEQPISVWDENSDLPSYSILDPKVDRKGHFLEKLTNCSTTIILSGGIICLLTSYIYYNI